jgi:hypothetical protein
MITLSNGDMWIIDDSEWEKAGISYEDTCPKKIPKTSIRKFIERLYTAQEKGEYLNPQKWMTKFGGSWDCNFSVYREVFGDAARDIIENAWSTVYIMRWGHVYVVFQSDDLGGYDVCTMLERFENLEEYKNAVLGKPAQKH